jgi:hypothetical protein
MNTKEPKPYSFEQRFHLGYAIQSLGEAIVSTDNYRVDAGVATAFRNIREFLSDIKPLPKFTEKEADFARAAHTYFRKYCDDALTTMLYRLIADGEGYGVWVAFCKGAVAHNYDYKEAIDEAEKYYQDHNEDSSNLYMRCCLETWGQKPFDEMTKIFKEEKWL